MLSGLLILLKLGFIFFYSPYLFSSLLVSYTSLYEKTDTFRFARTSEIGLHLLLFTLCLFFSSSFLFIYIIYISYIYFLYRIYIYLYLFFLIYLIFIYLFLF